MVELGFSQSPTMTPSTTLQQSPRLFISFILTLIGCVNGLFSREFSVFKDEHTVFKNEYKLECELECCSLPTQATNTNDATTAKHEPDIDTREKEFDCDEDNTFEYYCNGEWNASAGMFIFLFETCFFWSM